MRLDDPSGSAVDDDPLQVELIARLDLELVTDLLGEGGLSFRSQSDRGHREILGMALMVSPYYLLQLVRHRGAVTPP